MISSFMNIRIRHPITAFLVLSVMQFAWASEVLAQVPKRIGVVLFEGVLTSDVTAPMEVLGAAIAGGHLQDYEIVTIAPRAGTITTHEGIKLVANYDLASAPELDVLIVGSRYGMDLVLEDEEFMAFIEEQGRRVSWLASNCSGAFILAEAGLLDGKRATTYAGGEVSLQEQYPDIIVETGTTIVDDDDHLVTSNGSVVSYEAALELLRGLAGDAAAKAIADQLFYTRLLEQGGESP